MRVFLSWSGEQSRQVAIILKEWLPTVIQALDTWVSSADIEKGASWLESITDSLVKAEGVGVFCLTADNLKAPWLAYEAGALASHDRGRVATFLHRVTTSDVSAPLSLFQATNAASRDDVLLLLGTLNKRLQTPLPETRLNSAFDAHWSSLKSQLEAIPQLSAVLAQQPEKALHEMLEEVLNAVRRIEKDSSVRLSRSSTNGANTLRELFEERPAISTKHATMIEELQSRGLLASQSSTPAELLKRLKQDTTANRLAELLRSNGLPDLDRASMSPQIPPESKE